MKLSVTTVLLLCLLAVAGVSSLSSNAPGVWSRRDRYLETRAKVVEQNNNQRLGSSIQLSSKEQQVSGWMNELREKERISTAGKFPPAHNIYLYKQSIDESPMLPVMKGLPKGALLHIHFEAMFDFHWLVKHYTYHPNCYMNVESGAFDMKQELTPAEQPVWKLVNDLRDQSKDADKFDADLYAKLTTTEGIAPEAEGEAAWVKFGGIFGLMLRMFWFEPMARQYFVAAMDQLRDDNVQHVELRMVFGMLYDFEHGAYSWEEQAIWLKERINEYRASHPELSIVVIATSSRHSDRTSIYQDMKMSLDLIEKYPDVIVGYDMVAEEDTGHTTLYFLEEILSIQEEAKERGIDFPLFLHDGESAKVNNDNMYDAILLESRRIGHGFNLWRFPTLMDMVRRKGIALSICPISNQVLKLVKDLRNHPGAMYVNMGLPVTINSDDPGLLGYGGLYYDYWQVYMAWNTDLRTIKQLAINGLQHSALPALEKQQALAEYETRWQQFIDDIHMRI